MFKFRYKKVLAFCLMLNTSLATTNCMENKIIINEINKDEMKQKASDNLKKAKAKMEDLIEKFFIELSGDRKNLQSTYDGILDLNYSYNFDSATKKQIELLREIMENNFLDKKFEPKDFSLWFGCYLLFCKYSLVDINNKKKYSEFENCMSYIHKKIRSLKSFNYSSKYYNIFMKYREIMEINRFWDKQRISGLRIKPEKYENVNRSISLVLKRDYESLYRTLHKCTATSWNKLYQIYWDAFKLNREYLDEQDKEFKIYDIAKDYGFIPISDMSMVKDNKKFGKISILDYLFISSKNYKIKDSIDKKFN